METDEFLKAIEELKEKSREGWVIVVEGIKDEIALREIGIEGEIITFSGFLSTAEKVKDKNVIILTDYDSKGFEIEKGLLKILLSYGNVANVELKRRIFSQVKKEITKVEEIHRYLVRNCYEV
ncbi:MAG: hypothetical protein QXN34_05070 [Archaeoglobaceae archaeon]